MKLVSALKSRANRGFTLIEVMIAVAIVAILAGIAIPWYGEFAQRGRRVDAHKLLLDAADRQEQYFFDFKTYTTTLANLGFPGGTVKSENGYYTLGVAAGVIGSSCTPATGGAGCSGIAQCFTVTAPRTGAQSGDTECGNFCLDSRGEKWATGCSDQACVDKCW